MGDFSTMSFNERMRMTWTVIEEAGDIPAAVGAQTTSVLELQQLSRQLLWLLLLPKCPALFAFTSANRNSCKPESTTNLDGPTRD